METDTNAATSTPMFSLRLRGSSLVHTHSIHSKVSPKTVSKPDTYFEMARPSTSGWIVVYRSSVVKESVSPAWDEAVIPLQSLSPEPQSEAAVKDLNDYAVMITVYKSKKKKCKVIGSLETTVQVLLDASLAVNKMVDDNAGELQCVSIMDDESRGTFHLHARTSGSDNEMTGLISVLESCVGERQNLNSERFLTNDSYDECSTITSMEDQESTILSSISISPRRTIYKFVDYVNSGLDIDFCVAIDFTSSNGDPRIPGTLHYSR